MKKNAILIVSIIVVSLVIFVGNRHYNNKINTNSLNGKPSTPTQATEEKINYLSDNIFIYSFNGAISIYVKGSNKDSDRYIGYHLTNSSKELDREQTASNFNVWKLDGADEYQRNGKESFMKISNVVAKGEWEFALKESGANDFVGGRMHGDELLTDVKLIVDEEEVDIDGLVKGDFKEVKVITQSDIYRDNTISKELFKIGKTRTLYTFTKEGLTLEHEIMFEENLILERGYLAMFPILRHSEGATGNQITDTIVSNYDNKEYDVSKSGFNIPEVKNVNADKVTIFGKESRFSANVEVLEKTPEDLPITINLNNSPHYNKLYFPFIDGEYSIKKGDVWKQTTKYQIDTTN